MSENQPQVRIPDLCKLHASDLVIGAGYKPGDPWRALVIASQIALFQAATADPDVHKRVGGVIERFSELGCLACLLPNSFEQIEQAAKSHDLGDIKALGEKWIAVASWPDVLEG